MDHGNFLERVLEFLRTSEVRYCVIGGTGIQSGIQTGVRSASRALPEAMSPEFVPFRPDALVQEDRARLLSPAQVVWKRRRGLLLHIDAAVIRVSVMKSAAGRRKRKPAVDQKDVTPIRREIHIGIDRFQNVIGYGPATRGMRVLSQGASVLLSKATTIPGPPGHDTVIGES